MKGSSYREQDYAFGQIMLTLRTKLGLTQTGLAQILAVTRRAVGDWEAGNSYPKGEHLKRLITLAVEHKAFPPGHETDEIRMLWQAAHQKVILDEAWLKDLVLGASFSADVMRKQARVDWGEALAIPNFYGREWELKLLTSWITNEHCRVVSVVGLGGIGKSALTVHVMHQLADQFEVVIWRSLRDRPDWDTLLNSLLEVIAPQRPGEVQPSLEVRQSSLLDCMRGMRVLLVLDNMEAVLKEGQSSGQFLPSFENLARFLRLSAETEHQSCVLFTSREKPVELLEMEGNQAPMRTLRLSRLDAYACKKLLIERNIRGSAAELMRLVDVYAGNPLALKIVAQTVLDLFDGEIAPFLAHGELIYGGVRDLLHKHFARLSRLEQCILLWLAVLREPVTLNDLLVLLAKPVSHGHLLEAMEALHRRSLIERGQQPGTFTLQSVVLEYATAQLIEDVYQEIETGKPSRFIEHGLELAQVREYIRQSQERLIVIPILADLRNSYLQEEELEKRLQLLLSQFTQLTTGEQGYGPANLLLILRLVRGNLRGMDLSSLLLRGMYLQGTEMQDTTLEGTVLQDTVFHEAFDIPWSVAISDNNKYWATGSRRGEIRIWHKEGKILHLAWQAHTDTVRALAFSPDGSKLATGSWDGSVKLWDTESASLLWARWFTDNIECLAFAPNGKTLAASGDQAIIQLLDTASGSSLQAIDGQHGPVFALAWSPDGGMLASGGFDGAIRLWKLPGEQPEVSVQTLLGHTNWVTGLAFAPDGKLLASASWDATVKLWEVSEPGLHRTLTKHKERVRSVAWSPDGHLLASCGFFDHTIWLWDVEKESYRIGLRGHSGGVYNIVFTPDSRNLLSGSDDGNLRVWDVERGQCVHILQGYAVSLYDVSWSPDSTQLASVGSNKQVTIWDAEGLTPPRLLLGHRSLVHGVSWSPDGRLLASGSLDNTIRLWEPSLGKEKQVLRSSGEVNSLFYSVAWNPDGTQLASGTFQQGVQVWDMPSCTLGWVGTEQLTRIRRVVWSPDGNLLASCGDDGTIFIWDASSGHAQVSLKGHRGMILSVVWSPDGTRIASAGSSQGNSDVIIWDVIHPDQVSSWSELDYMTYSLAWSPDGEVLITGSTDGMIRWWDTRSIKCLSVLKGHEGTVQSLKVSPDGRMLASCGDDNAIQLWDILTGEHLRTLRLDRLYERLNISGIIGLTDAQKTTLRALGAVDGL
jgi:WD40 repeat protein/transcriptional regulator with XRE-family HTH domain